MPQQCNTSGKLEDPQVPQTQKQYLDEKKTTQTTNKKTNPKSYIPQKSLSSFRIHPLQHMPFLHV